MRKQESVHLHALLLEIASHLDERPESPPIDLGEYYDLGVGPSSIHRSKGAHEEAIQLLAGAVGASLRREADQGQEPPVQ